MRRVVERLLLVAAKRTKTLLRAKPSKDGGAELGDFGDE